VFFANPKAGKTQLVNEIGNIEGDVLFLAFERGHDDIEGYVENIDEWPQFQAKMAELKASDKFKMFAIDTLDSAYIVYHQWFLKDKGIAYEGDTAQRGRGWIELRRGFMNEMFNLQHLNRGYFIISHAREDSLSPDGDSDKTVIRANYPKDAQDAVKMAIEGTVDAIWYLGSSTVVKDKKPERVKTLFCNDLPGYEIGTRFNMPDKLALINDDPAASAARIVNAYKKLNGGIKS